MFKSKKRSRKNLRKRRTRRNLARGSSTSSSSSSSSSSSNKVQCCMCNKQTSRDKTLVPVVCLKRHGERAHRICQKCWWNKKTGFARENAPHGCPGCKKDFPLTAPLPRVTPNLEDIIVISD